MNDNTLIVDILEQVFGDVRKHNWDKGQISFDCPVCSYDIKGLSCGDGKGNLEINYMRGIYKCWACSETHNTKGRMSYIVKRWGSPQDSKRLNLIIPDEFKSNGKSNKIKLPQGYVLLSEQNPNDLTVKQALNYLHKRNLSDELIEKYKIGITTSGEYKNKIIIPSYNREGELKYFVARSYVSSKMKYKNPDVSKMDLIFNEEFIDWNENIYLVEGVFDMFFVDNSIPLLGKVLSDYLWSELYNKSKGLIYICLDGDAWDDTIKLYHKLNGGKLLHRIKVIKLPMDKDIADLKGDIKKYETEIEYGY